MVNCSFANACLRGPPKKLRSLVEGSDEEKAVDNKHKPRPTAAKAAASKVAPGGRVAPAGTNLDANDIGGKDGIGKGEKATSEGGKGKAGKGKDEEATSEGGRQGER